MERTQGEGGLRIQLLGAFRVWVGPQLIPDSAWRRRKAASLLKLLALVPEHLLHREEALELLWPGLPPDAGENNLHRTLHIVRHALEPDRSSGTLSPYLGLHRDLLVLSPHAGLHVDVDAFMAAAEAAQRTEDPQRYEAALALYTGDLLPEDQYEDWVAVRRDELRRLYHDLLRRLSCMHEVGGQYSRAIEVLQRLTGSEPAEEGAHANLMRLYALVGRRQEALRQYQRLEEALRREVEAEPDVPTRRLYEEIQQGRFTPGAAGAPGGHGTSGAGALGDVTTGATAGSTGSPPPTNLPFQLSSFVGRGQELAEVRRLLASTRLLTLSGAGGVGKSRLAVQVATQLQESYRDGVWLIQLAALSDERLVPQRVAVALGVREQTDRPLTQTLVDVLRPKRLLLVLDNCEHLLAASAELAEALLERCPGLRILTTSRRALGISGEVAWRVPSLTIPQPADPSDLACLMRFDAVSLFLERTRSVRPDFVLTPENAPAVVEVCRRLDGVPLALELAAARMRVLTVEQLAERLEDGFGVLGSGSTSPLPRHRTLRAAMDWSYGLLGKGEQRLFRRLAVFAGGWTLEAAEGVCSGQGIEEREVLELLSELVEQSLLVVSKQEAAMRYRLLEPVRQYAAEKLADAGEADALRQRHAQWYLGFADRAELVGPDQTAWFARLDRERDNLRAALQWAQQSGQAETLCRLAAAVWRFWWVRGHLKEGRRWLDAALAAEQSPTVWRVRALEGAGTLARAQLDYERATSWLEQSLTLARQLGDKEGIAQALMGLGVIAGTQGDTRRAAGLFEESLALHRALGNQAQVATALGNLAAGAEREGDVDRAIALQEESLAICRRVGNEQLIARYLDTLARTMLDVGDVARAKEMERESLQLRRMLQDQGGIAECLEVLAEVAVVQRQPARAAALEGAAEALREAIGLPLPLEARPRHERFVAQMRRQLEERHLTAEREGVAAMGLEEAIDYALSTDEPSADAVTVTPREREVAALVAQGLSNHQIGAELGISDQTAAVHVRNILKKLRQSSRADIAVWAREQGLVREHLGGKRVERGSRPASAPALRLLPRRGR